MKNIFAAFSRTSHKENMKLVNTALNRNRLIKFSNKLKKSNAEVVIKDYSVGEEKLTRQSSRPAKASAD